MTTAGQDPKTEAFIPEMERLGAHLSTHFTPVEVFSGEIKQYEGMGMWMVGAAYPSSSPQGRDIAEIDLQMRLRTFNLLDAYRIVGVLSRYPIVIGPIAMDVAPPATDVGAAEVNIAATILAALRFPEGFIDRSMSVPTQSITIRFEAGEEVLRTITVMDGP